MADIHDETTTTTPETPTPPLSPESARARSRTRGSHEPQDVVPTTAAARRTPARADRALDHARACARIAEDNRGKDILLLDLRGATPLIDFFVIVTANSRRQSASIASEIDQEMKQIGEQKLGIEGAEEGRWTLIDYGDFVVHVFSEEARAYYALEEIWGDALQLDWHDADHPAPPSDS